ncbi:MAG: N-acetylmuramoyl-L-alanine amidase [Clostridia bacterium]|nr:N-acetylmuramoyl-L-alanine amidase [Clostridia bacterium]
MRTTDRSARRPVWQFVAFLLVLAAVCALLSFFSPRPDAQTQAPAAIPTLSGRTVVLDAGHGGEDGGAISVSGSYEKDLNLQIALLVADQLHANGISVILTRDRDVLLYDPASDHVGHKKEQDLAARRKLAEDTENCIFVSIHMNAFPQSKYRGLQVWYSPNHPHSATLAQSVQSTVRTYLQPQNARRTKAASQSIYLLHYLQVPAVLIECGFLSNPDEAALLDSPAYRHRLALLISLSILQAETA